MCAGTGRCNFYSGGLGENEKISKIFLVPIYVFNPSSAFRKSKCYNGWQYVFYNGDRAYLTQNKTGSVPFVSACDWGGYCKADDNGYNKRQKYESRRG